MLGLRARSQDGGGRRAGRLYYGWYIVGVCNVVAMMTWGIGVFNQGVFLGYFVERYGWPRAALSLGPMLFYVWAGLVGVLIGRVIDRQGPRLILIAGALLLGAGTTALGFAAEPWHVYPGFLLLGSGYACLHTVTLGAIISRWFTRQRARAMGAATFGASIGGMILAPLNAMLLERWGGPAGGLTLAAIAIVLVVPLAIWVVKDGPEAVGQTEETGVRSQESGGEAATNRIGTESIGRLAADSTAGALADERDWRVGEAARTVAFWAIAICFHLTMMAQGGFLIHQVLILQPTFGFVTAATVVSVTTIMGAVGRTVFTVVGDRWAPRQIAAAMFVLQAVGLALSAIGSGMSSEAGTFAPWVLVAGSITFGLTMGIIVSIQPLVAADCFGRRSFGRVYGPIYLAIQLGTGFGSLVFGLTATAFGSYGPVLGTVAATLLLAAFGMRWAVRPPWPQTR
jgi:MFS family permease